jgi:hypothetical protein
VDPQQTSEDAEGTFVMDVEPSTDVEELEEEVTVSREEEVGEYIEPPEEAKVYVGNLPSPCMNALSRAISAVLACLLHKRNE